MQFLRVFVTKYNSPVSLLHYLHQHSASNSYYNSDTDMDRLTMESIAVLDESLERVQDRRFGIAVDEAARRGLMAHVCQQVFGERVLRVGHYQHGERRTHHCLEDADVIVVSPFDLAKLSEEGKLTATDLVILNLTDSYASDYSFEAQLARRRQAETLVKSFVQMQVSLIWVDFSTRLEDLYERFVIEHSIVLQSHAAVKQAEADEAARKERELHRQTAVKFAATYEKLNEACGPDISIFDNALMMSVRELRLEVRQLECTNGWSGIEKWGEHLTRVSRPTIESLIVRTENLIPEVKAQMLAHQEICQVQKVLHDYVACILRNIQVVPFGVYREIRRVVQEGARIDGHADFLLEWMDDAWKTLTEVRDDFAYDSYILRLIDKALAL